MKQHTIWIAGMVIVATTVFLLFGGLNPSGKALVACVGLTLSVVSVLILSSLGQSITQIKVGVTGVNFSHDQRPKSERPPAEPNVIEVYEKALTAFNEKRYDDAIPLYEGAFKLGPDYWPAKVNKGICLQFSGRLDRALDEYSEITARCQEQKFLFQAYGNSGDIHMALYQIAAKKPDQKKHLRLAFETYSASYAAEKNATSVFNLYTIQDHRGNTADAKRLLEELKAYPEYDALMTHKENNPIKQPPQTAAKT